MVDGVEIAKRWFREVWREDKAETIDALLTGDCRAHGLGPEPLVGPEGFRGFRDALRAQFDVRVDVLQGIGEGDRAAVQCRATLTHKATGRSGSFTGACFFKLREGRICESSNEWNFVDLLEQIGVAPEGGLAKVLFEPHDALPKWA